MKQNTDVTNIKPEVLDGPALIKRFKREGFKHPAIAANMVLCKEMHKIKKGYKCPECGYSMEMAKKVESG